MLINETKVKCPKCGEIISYSKMLSINPAMFSKQDYERIMRNQEKECFRKCPGCNTKLDLQTCEEIIEEDPPKKSFLSKLKSILPGS
ncbi:MAG: hypothetical protein ACOCUF_01170 [Patescibacteria group bacterium]